MNYVSTRGGALGADQFSDVLLGGLAPDGGLVMPSAYPAIDPSMLARWRNLDYPSLAYEVMSPFAPDVPESDLRGILQRAYTAEVFGGDPAITPVSMLEPGLHLAHLSNGPTLAFKDVAMQFLGQMFEWLLEQRGQRLNILGATSGDTGSAAEYAMKGRRGVSVFMLSPHGRMSEFQRAQMFSLNESNIFNIAVPGVFDDCQDMVKAVSEDLEFKRANAIGAVNSINWGRVIAQVVYYFKTYFAVTANEQQSVSFCVPSGNFGNVLAGHVARMMGLPIKRLVVATNENNVLDDFFRTGIYRVRGRHETHKTSSPSMDISKASNFERFVFDLLERDAAELKRLWHQLSEVGHFDLSGTPAFGNIEQFGFVSGTSTHQNRLSTIASTYERYGRVVDTHTADGLFVAQRWREVDVPMICLETALPVKFAQTIVEAIGVEPPVPPQARHLAEAAQRYCWLPRSVPALKDYLLRHAVRPPS